jgi:hypothetical protein
VNWIFPLETLVVAIVVAVIPYLVVRRLVSWLAKPGQGPRPPQGNVEEGSWQIDR